jgi:enoyl-CoA hydratase
MKRDAAVGNTASRAQDREGPGGSTLLHSPNVRIENEGPVTTITIVRPDVRNAIDRETAEALADAFRTFNDDANASVAVLAGAGRHFSAGADLKAFANGTPNDIDDDGDGPLGPTRMTLDKPVIAAVSGYAVAGGLELAIWCDLRVVEDSAIFGVFCRRFGVPLIDGGTARLPRLIGLGRALDLILTGRPVGAKEALAFGLVDRVVPDGHALASAQELAREIASFPQACLRADRRSAIENCALPIDEAIAREFARGRSVLPEAANGALRFASGEGRGGSFAQTSTKQSEGPTT